MQNGEWKMEKGIVKNNKAGQGTSEAVVRDVFPERVAFEPRIKEAEGAVESNQKEERSVRDNSSFVWSRNEPDMSACSKEVSMAREEGVRGRIAQYQVRQVVGRGG